jgi:hypothetical protein
MSSAPIKSIMPVVINLGAVKAEVDTAIDCFRTDQERAAAWRTEAFEANPSLYGAADGIDLDMCDMAATRHVLRSVAGTRVTDATDRDREEFWGAA